MTKIEARFKLGNKEKHFHAKSDSKISELIKKLKSIMVDQNVKIELFYGGRFLNPNFTLEQIKYNEKYPINVFTSSNEYTELYNNLSQSRLITSFSEDEIDNFRKSQVMQGPDAEDRYICKLNQLKKGYNQNIQHRIQEQAEKNGVHESVFYYICNFLEDSDKALNFFDEEMKIRKKNSEPKPKIYSQKPKNDEQIPKNNEIKSIRFGQRPRNHGKIPKNDEQKPTSDEQKQKKYGKIPANNEQKPIKKK